MQLICICVDDSGIGNTFFHICILCNVDLLGMDVGCCCCCCLGPMASGGTGGCGCWFNIMEGNTCARWLGASQVFMGGVLVPPVTLSDGGMCLKFRQCFTSLKITVRLDEFVIYSNSLEDNFY